MQAVLIILLIEGDLSVIVITSVVLILVLDSVCVFSWLQMSPRLNSLELMLCCEFCLRSVTNKCSVGYSVWTNVVSNCPCTGIVSVVVPVIRCYFIFVSY